MIDNEIYKAQADFEAWISGKRKKPEVMKAVVYDQFGRIDNGHGIVYRVSGTRDEVLAQYNFYKSAYPDRSLGLSCEEYFAKIMDGRKRRLNI